MNKILFTGGIALLGFLAASCNRSSEKSTDIPPPVKPNVILIITDDQGWGDIASHGNDTLSTPNIDNLASESYRFNRFYVSPVCAPTRASLLTGKYHLRTGVHGVTGRREVMRNTEFSIAEIFRAEDYKTSYYGKWHNGAQYPHNPTGQGFGYFFGFCAGHWNNYFDTHLELNGRMIKTEGYITDILTDSAIAEIKAHNGTPFFQFVSYNTPHSPFQVPDLYFDKYKEKGLADKKAAVYGMVENIDYNVGRLIAAIEEKGLSENTIIIFMTDNGPNTWRYNGGMRGKKAWVDEGGVRVPLFMRIPWLSENEVIIDEMTAHIDVFPTLFSLCGLELPVGLELDGINLAPFISGSEKKLPDRFIYTDRGLGSKRPWGMRSEEYLLTVKQDTFLYNLKDDPQQQNDISDDHPELIEEYIESYNKWYRDVTAFGLKPPPIEIGHTRFPLVRLPAHEAKKSLYVKFREGNGWANDWLVNFKNPDDSIWWNVKVQREAYYQIRLKLSSPPENIGGELILSNSVFKDKVNLEKEYKAEKIPSPDRVERNEIYEMNWPEIVIENVYLPEGIYDITLTPGRDGLLKDIEVKGMEIILKTEEKQGEKL